MKKKQLWMVLIVSFVIIVAIVVVILIVTGRRGASSEPEPVTVTVDINALPDEVLEPLNRQLLDFMSNNPNIRVSAEKKENADLTFSRSVSAVEGAVVRPWRSIGWRLYAKLPTLATLEARWKRQLILPFSNNKIGLSEFINILEMGLAKELVPIALVENDEAETAWKLYTERLKTEFDGYVVSYPALRDALGDLAAGKIMFLFWDDRLPTLIQKQDRPQHRGFDVPGSRAGENSFFVGRVTYLVLSPEAAAREEPVQLMKYLTSPGVGKAFQRELPGEFFYWDPSLIGESLPSVSSPGELIDLKQ